MMNGSWAPKGVLVLGILTILASMGHGLAGGAALARELVAAAVAADLRGIILIGWHFGSLGLAVMGLVTVLSSFALRQGSRHAYWSALVIGLALALFGLSSSLLRFPNPHFLFFFALGLLQCAFVGSLGKKILASPPGP